ncbi:MAG: hypothetical protein DRK00_11485, partial [Thermoprotei archaeon]
MLVALGPFQATMASSSPEEFATLWHLNYGYPDANEVGVDVLIVGHRVYVAYAVQWEDRVSTGVAMFDLNGTLIQWQDYFWTAGAGMYAYPSALYYSNGTLYLLGFLRYPSLTDYDYYLMTLDPSNLMPLTFWVNGKSLFDEVAGDLVVEGSEVWILGSEARGGASDVTLTWLNLSDFTHYTAKVLDDPEIREMGIKLVKFGCSFYMLASRLKPGTPSEVDYVVLKTTVWRPTITELSTTSVASPPLLGTPPTQLNIVWNITFTGEVLHDLDFRDCYLFVTGERRGEGAVLYKYDESGVKYWEAVWKGSMWGDCGGKAVQAVSKASGPHPYVGGDATLHATRDLLLLRHDRYSNITGTPRHSWSEHVDEWDKGDESCGSLYYDSGFIALVGSREPYKSGPPDHNLTVTLFRENLSLS